MKERNLCLYGRSLYCWAIVRVIALQATVQLRVRYRSVGRQTEARRLVVDDSLDFDRFHRLIEGCFARFQALSGLCSG